ncbi:hypothetical protein A0H81_01645 [Grifola frondosa]|uniref:Uncharacterized protein n=1 Tax=Grifola frondosa TaxID=5627 RepID=A0A1C7MK69_GRIFR|nr:hypothetical protein A0H81_01645 [Grifola frondosa]
MLALHVDFFFQAFRNRNTPEIRDGLVCATSLNMGFSKAACAPSLPYGNRKLSSANPGYMKLSSS